LYDADANNYAATIKTYLEVLTTDLLLFSSFDHQQILLIGHGILKFRENLFFCIVYGIISSTRSFGFESKTLENFAGRRVPLYYGPMSKVISNKSDQFQRRKQFFENSCRHFDLDPSFVEQVLLNQVPECWTNEFGAGIRGGRAASYLALAYARVKCAEGNHESEYHLCLGAAKKVITDEAAAYRDAWRALLIAMEHCYQELPTEQQPQYAQSMLEVAREAIEDIDRRFLIPGYEKPSLLGQLDILVSKLATCEALVGIEDSQSVRDYKRRQRNRSLRKQSGPYKPLFHKSRHYEGFQKTTRENRVAWFKKRYYEKYGEEAPADLFVASIYTPEGIQIKIDYYSLFDRNDYKQFQLDMEALYREQSGLPAKNQGWVNQAFLARCVEKVLTGIEVVCEANPTWLYGQRLDIFVPSLKLAFEYQGEQHYFPLEHLGGEQGLKDRQEMDERKRAACEKAGVTLIEWRYSDNISVENVRARMLDAGIKIEK
jgi:hypothetical protein